MVSAIGPQLPPHLQKRKRTPEDETELGSPPPKTTRRENDDEIALGDDSDDGFGPAAPAPMRKTAKEMMPPSIGPSLPPGVASSAAASASKKRSIGPSLPPTAASGNGDEIPLDSDDHMTGPALPPKRVLGPAPPPAPLSERPPTGPDTNSSEDDDDDDDDGWGPALPGASSNTKTTSSTTLGPSHPSASQPEPAAPKRDDWMLAPPSSSSGPRKPDPTKLKSRKFASGPRAAATDGKPAGVSSIWTETPEEKARRLANSVLGREDAHNTPAEIRSRPEAGSGGSGGGGRDGSGGGGSRADEARIKSYIEQTRGKSLVAEHQAARAAGKASSATLVKSGDHAKWGAKGGGEGEGADDDDDPSKRAFNWEKDMKVGGQISGSQRKELLNRAANFGGRFQSGKYL
ncbi:uncharacterized protein B0H64DRAFT_470623 [Chaetomium fimeti]|uniref:DUF3752 domain-containing protein n=1 Tax=Chaetomium fimeti TaxID=1854472 RepID=A0AAE0HPV2_9PEZI|nr:hypothetical protein B0H64DRAFT_470623 [Chaetomium fimeti]